MFCSNLRLDTLPKILSKNRCKVNEVGIPDNVQSSRSVRKKINGVMFYSPSTVQSYLQKIQLKKWPFVLENLQQRKQETF